MVPVVDRENKPLMPCSEKRARKMVESGKATPFWSFGCWCIRLNQEPSGREIQDVACGIDPGSKMEGFTVKSTQKTFINIQSRAVTWVKNKMDLRRTLRRSRRNRKGPCRQPRWANRVRSNLWVAPSTRARWQLKLRVLKRLARIYPIKYVVIEDIKASPKEGKVKSRSFQMVMQGKNWFYSEIRRLDFVLMLAMGYETSEKRRSLGLKKIKDKMSPNFSVHCVDSWTLASMAVGGESPGNYRVTMIQPMIKNHRNLHVQQPAKGGIRKNYGSTRSIGFERGSVVKHPKFGICLIGGTRNGRVSLRSLAGKIISRHARPSELKFKSFNSFLFVN